MTLIKDISIKEVIRPLMVLFSTSLGKKNLLKSIIVKVRLNNGLEGTGECPTSFVSRFEDLESIKGFLKKILPGLINTPIDIYNEKIGLLRKDYRDFPMTISGLEVALFRAYLKTLNKNEHQFWGSKTNEIETDITIPFITEKEPLDRWLRYSVKKGFKIFKIKVSGHIEEDIKLLSYIYGFLSNSLGAFHIRLDGNQGFTAHSLMRFLEKIERKGFDIQLFEQPLLKNDYKGMEAVKKNSRIPIILDETVFNGDDMTRVTSYGLCDGVNIKVAKSGVSESLNITNTARKHGLKLMVGCMTETMVGLSTGIYMASGNGVFDFVDLDSVFYLHHKNIYDDILLKPPFFVISTDKK
ncbi:MAG: hypothetical protein N3D15_00195 [Syntrophorhabdaceae bacterium]|nr:hypothetical protein [Syntrophorhabdaceae bacterium]